MPLPTEQKSTEPRTGRVEPYPTPETQPERRALQMKDAQVRIHDDGADKRIVGYASVFYDGTPATEFQLWEDMVERIMPGTFDRALAEKDDVRGLFNHDPDHMLGRTASGTMTLAIDKRGLSYEIEPGDTAVANDVIQHITRGDVDGSSFAFHVTDEDVRKEDDVFIREIRGVELFDVGPVTFPAYTASTTGFRSNTAVAAEVRMRVRIQRNNEWAEANEQNDQFRRTTSGVREPVASQPNDTDPESIRLKKWYDELDKGDEGT